MKMHQKRKNGQNWQKSAKIIKKIDFPYNNFPKKDISLRKCTKNNKKTTKKNNAFGEKKVNFFFRACRALYRCDPPGGGVL